jgi:hypothetical protein
MRKLCLCLALVSLLGLGGQAFAVINTIDDVPASTLLLPYFEVDIADPVNGVNTLFSINNASATAVLTHVTVWTDQSVPVLDFDVYLTGYDVVTVSMRDILVNGNLPRTASVGQDPSGSAINAGISPRGVASTDINFASCTGILPYGPGAVSANFRAHLQALLQGNQSPVTGNCAGSKQDDDILRGYVTVDTVSACNVLFPSQMDEGYLAVLTNQNVIWGDYFYVNSGQNFAQGETLVHIEACPTCFVTGDHTFYGRYISAAALDAREPLPTTMAARYLNGAGFTGGTDFLIWREGDDSDVGYNCNLPGPPSWYPLDAAQIVIFDETEQPVTSDECPSGDPTCEQLVSIPNEAQRVDVAADLLTPFSFGWAYLNLQHTELIPEYADTFAQMWLTTVMDANGRFSVGFDGVQLDNANTPNTTIIPVGN